MKWVKYYFGNFSRADRVLFILGILALIFIIENI